MKNSLQGDVLTWGTGAYGRLGHGTVADQPKPRRIASNQIEGRGILCISGGLYHSALVTDDNGLYIFGTNATGCLGVGRGIPSIQSSDDSAGQSEGQNEQTFLPRRIRSFPSRVRIVQVSVGGDLMGSHTLAVSSQGRLFAWGAAKACGVGAVDGEDVIVKPTLVSDFVRSEDSREGATTERVVYASAGGSCSAVITSDGVLYTFGISASGRLGYRDKLRVQYRPRRVDALLGESITAVSAGGGHMLAVSNRGVLYAWGENSKGQLGLSDLVDRHTPTRVPHPRQGLWSASIAAGQSHSLAVDIDGRLYSWGAAGAACIGRGDCLGNSDRERILSTSFQITNLSHSWMRPGEVFLPKVSRISAGATHSLVTTTTGLIYAFGSPSQVGFLAEGIKSSTLLSVPRLIAPSPTFPSTQPAAISCGNYHSLVVMPSMKQNVGLELLVSSLQTKSATHFHDCFIDTKNDGKTKSTMIWLNSTALRACVSVSAWVSFFLPQLKFVSSPHLLSEKPPTSITDVTTEKSNAAEEFRFSPDLRQASPSPNSGTSTSVGSILDDWVNESSENPLSEIPPECLFSNISTTKVIEFFASVFLDDVAVIDDEEVLNVLLRLSICGQLDRIEKLIEKRIKRIERDRTYFHIRLPDRTRTERAIETLWDTRDSSGDVVVECEGPLLGQIFLENQQENKIVCHSFVLQSIGLNTSCLQHVQFPSDVVHESIHFGYWSVFSTRFDLSDDIVGMSKFWLLLSHFAHDFLKNPIMFAAAIDRVIGLVNRENWKVLLTQFSTVISAGIVSDKLIYRQVSEAILSIGSTDICEKILSSKSFNSVNTYTYSKQEIPVAIKRALVELDSVVTTLVEDDPIFGPDLLRRVTETIESHVHMARMLRGEMERYREMEIAANGGSTSQDDGKLKRWIKSMMVSHRGGPSVIAAFRDLGIFVALFAISSTYIAESAFVRKFLPTSDYWSTVGILVLNFAFLIVAGYLVYAGVISSKV